METKVCLTCKEEKPVTEFYSNGYQSNGRKKFKPNCKSCEHPLRKRSKTLKIIDILKEKGQKLECELCGYNKNLAALTFHHVDEQEKDFNISDSCTLSREKFKAEIDKCVLLCHNCHMEVHYPHLDIVDDEL